MALSHLTLKSDGPTVVEAPPHMLGFLQDRSATLPRRHRPARPRQGQGRQVPRLAAGLQGQRASRVLRRALAHVLGDVRCRGFQVDGKTEQAVSLMKQIKIYPLDKASSPPPMEFLNGSGKDIDTLFPDNFRLLRAAGHARRRGTVGQLWPVGAFDDAANRHREGPTIRPGRQDTRASVGGGTAWRSDGTREHVRIIGPRCLLLP